MTLSLKVTDNRAKEENPDENWKNKIFAWMEIHEQMDTNVPKEEEFKESN